MRRILIIIELIINKNIMSTKVPGERNVSYDILRIIMCIFVIAIHTQPVEYLENHKFISASILPVLYLCNPLFFMISGKFNLSKSFETANDILKFYKNKLIRIVIPWMVYSALYYTWNIIEQHSYIEIEVFVKDFVKNMLSNNVSFHFWFMYALFGMLISTPFLAILLNNMTILQQKLLFYIATIWMICSSGLPSLKIDFGMNNFFLNGWLYFYYAGWYLTKEDNIKKNQWLYLAGAVGYFITIVATLWYPDYAYGRDWAISYIVFTFAVYVFAIMHFNVPIIWLRQIVCCLSKRTFSVYMFHTIVIIYISCLNIVKIPNKLVNYLVTMITIFFVSAFVSYFIDALINLVVQFVKNVSISKKLKYGA